VLLGNSICSWNARVGIVFLDGLLGGGQLHVSWKQHSFLEYEGGSCFAQGLVGLVGMSESPAMASSGGGFGVNGNSICSWNARVGIVFLDGLLGWWRIACFLETAFVPGI
jgi:hypothetical protein